MPANPNSVPNISIGGNYNGNKTAIVPSAVISDPTNSLGYFTLTSIGSGASITAAHFGIFVKNGAQYQVPSGKTCKVVSVSVYGSNSNADWQFAHSLTQMANNATTITSGTYQGLANAKYCHEIIGTNIVNELQMTYEFPSLSYPCFQPDIGGTFVWTLVCREV